MALASCFLKAGRFILIQRRHIPAGFPCPTAVARDCLPKRPYMRRKIRVWEASAHQDEKGCRWKRKTFQAGQVKKCGATKCYALRSAYAKPCFRCNGPILFFTNTRPESRRRMVPALLRPELSPEAFSTTGISPCRRKMLPDRRRLWGKEASSAALLWNQGKHLFAGK